MCQIVALITIISLFVNDLSIQFAAFSILNPDNQYITRHITFYLPLSETNLNNEIQR